VNSDIYNSPPTQEENQSISLPTPPPSPVHRVFVGRDGLRAGWSLLIFLLITAALLFGVHFIAQRIHPMPHQRGPLVLDWKFEFLNEGIPFLCVLLVTWIMSKIERRPNGAYGLGGQRKTGLFFRGMAWGIVFISLLVFTLWKMGLLVFERRLVFGADVLLYGAIWLTGFLLVGLIEEYLTRGYLQYTVTRGLAGVYRAIFKSRHSEAVGFWSAAILFSFLFGLGHSRNPGESPIGVVAAGLAGLLFCFSLWRTGSLWWAVGFHCAWDWGQSFLYGVADSGIMVQHHLFATHPLGRPILSGGTTGPEGSVFVLVILALSAVVIVMTLPRRQNPYLVPRRTSTGIAGESRLAIQSNLSPR
jgi:uncharacterized protein